MSAHDNGSGGDVLDPTDLTHWVQGARRGLRRDVVELVQRIEQGELFVPLAKQVPGATIGEQMALDDDLTIAPHLLEDDQGRLFSAMFTRPDILEPVAEQLGWRTDEGALEYCSLPAKVGLDLAQQNRATNAGAIRACRWFISSSEALSTAARWLPIVRLRGRFSDQSA